MLVLVTRGLAALKKPQSVTIVQSSAISGFGCQPSTGDLRMQLRESVRYISVAQSGSNNRTGTITLDPTKDSLSSKTLKISISLSSSDGQLRFGDLRKAAGQLESSGENEGAQRLWAVVSEAAQTLGDAEMATSADGRSSEILDRMVLSNVIGAGRPAIFDYEMLALDHMLGLSISKTAEKNDCSGTTVKRAIKYVSERDRIMKAHPEFVADVRSGTDVSKLAKRYETPDKTMRWIVISQLERRSAPRD